MLFVSTSGEVALVVHAASCATWEIWRDPSFEWRQKEMITGGREPADRLFEP